MSGAPSRPGNAAFVASTVRFAIVSLRASWGDMVRLPELTRAVAPLALGFLLLLLATASSVWLSVRQETSAYWVRHTLEAEGALNALLNLISDAETGQRGYIITGREDYLEPHTRAVGRIGAALDDVQRRTADNPLQQAALARLRPLISERVGILEQTVAMRRDGRTRAAMDIVGDGRGIRLMTEIRGQIDIMRAEERRLLAARTRETQNATRNARWLLILSVAVVTLLAFFTLRESANRIASLEQMAARLRDEAAERAAAQDQVTHLQKVEAVGQLTGGIAHDFNNMLAIIIGSLNMAQRRLSQGDGKIDKFLDSAQEGARRAAELTARLLAFSRRQTLSPQVLDINKLVISTSELLRRTLGERVEIETVLSGGLWRVHADVGQIESSIVNLAVNARDAMPNGGKLTIETANTDLDERYARAHAEVTAGQYVMVSITDTGVGMAPDVVARAFDPFFTTKQVGKGTGLGLSQLFGFVKQSGGHVKIYSEVGEGTTVRVYLPRYTGAEQAVEQRAAASEPRVGSASERILVVEDDAGVREVSVSALRELGYSVLEASGGAEALRLLDANEHIALLFTDVVMPEMGGRVLAEEAVRRRPELKVLYTTGYTRNAVVHHGILDPGTAYLPKPFTLEQLASKVREVLDAA
ncbi:two-component sensor histidine kinase [alpha proteobacterium U9-1i]|nr:two-component sensor histidine kinase [alpha proteobacterium U9-1i]